MALCVCGNSGGDVKECGSVGGGGGGVTEVDVLTASMALRRGPMLTRLGSAGATFPYVGAVAGGGGLLADDKSIYSLYSSLLRLHPAAAGAVLGLTPAAAAVAAAAMVRPPAMSAVFPQSVAAVGQTPNTTTTTATVADRGPTPGCDGELKLPCSGGGGGVAPANSLVNGGHRYRPYAPPASLATVAKRLDASTVRQSN